MPSSPRIIQDNSKHGGTIAPNAFIPNNVKVEYPINLMHNTTVYANTSIGKFTYINVGTIVYPHTHIGKFCSIARNCELGVAAHPIV